MGIKKNAHVINRTRTALKCIKASGLNAQLSLISLIENVLCIVLNITLLSQFWLLLWRTYTLKWVLRRKLLFGSVGRQQTRTFVISHWICWHIALTTNIFLVSINTVRVVVICTLLGNCVQYMMLRNNLAKWDTFQSLKNCRYIPCWKFWAITVALLLF